MFATEKVTSKGDIEVHIYIYIYITNIISRDRERGREAGVEWMNAYTDGIRMV